MTKLRLRVARMTDTVRNSFLWNNLPVVMLYLGPLVLAVPVATVGVLGYPYQQPSRHVTCWSPDGELVYDGVTTGTLVLDQDRGLFTDARTEREITVDGRCSLRLQS